jgi:hypothetical protein
MRAKLALLRFDRVAYEYSLAGKGPLAQRTRKVPFSMSGLVTTQMFLSDEGFSTVTDMFARRFASGSRGSMRESR